MPDIHLKNYLRLVVEILPVKLQELEIRISSDENKFSQWSQETRDGYLGISHTYSSNQLRACFDSLKTLELLSAASSDSVSVNVTQNGVAGLVRQALESIATYSWLIEPDEDEGKMKRAHSYQIADLQERLSYYKDLGDNNEFERSKQLLNACIRNGLEQGFREIFQDGDGNEKQRQVVALPGITDLCKKIRTPVEVITPKILEHYSGMGNAVWLYRWSSGLAHGKFWVNLFKIESESTQITAPNYLNLSIILLTIIRNLENLLSM